MMAKKVLIIRLSSIGDIVLTTPVIRIVKKQVPGAEVHFLTKKTYFPIVEANPYIDKIHLFEDLLSDIVSKLQEENFDYIIDLHKNTRTFFVKRKLKVPSKSFHKLNIKKWLAVNFKRSMPDVHIVDRYVNTLKDLGVSNDDQGLDYFIPPDQELKVNEFLPNNFQSAYLAFVIGGSYFTKILPADKVVEIGRRTSLPLVLIGGPDDTENGDTIVKRLGSKAFNSCGKLSINQSASLIHQAQKVLTNDTGLMHIAAAFQKPTLSFWGNTIPEFGMYPYAPKNDQFSKLMEVKDLGCRPCSKLGFKKCPKKHFYCMNLIEIDEVVEWANAN